MLEELKITPVSDNDGTWKTVSIRELRTMKFKKPTPLLTPWFHTGESCMVFSPPGVGKSFFAMSTAIAVAGGGSFLGWKAPEARKVLLIDGEMPLSTLLERTDMLAPGILKAGGVGGGDWEDNLDITPRMHPDSGMDFVNLCDETCRATISAKAINEGYALIILDNLSVLADVVDENSAGRMHSIVEFLLELKKAGVAIMLIHHSGKNEKATTARGSSKLNTSFETIISLHHQSKTLPLGCEFRLDWTKRRNAAKADDAHPMAVKLVDGVWDYNVDADAELVTLIRAVKSGEYSSQAELSKVLGYPDRKRVSRLKARAIKQGLITDAEWGQGFTKYAAMRVPVAKK